MNFFRSLYRLWKIVIMHAVRGSAGLTRDHSRKGIDTHSPEWLRYLGPFATWASR